MKTNKQNLDLIELAEYIYEEQKEFFIKDIVDSLRERITSGETQLKNGESMNFDEFKSKFIKEHFLQDFFVRTVSKISY
ncbi:hypothetical protein [uncultured Gammaproteobacteria bacterium]|nr:hypothetical protein [uncultured Gammaproteobacteria bacterium]